MVAARKRKKKRPEISVRTPDPELKKRLVRVSGEINRHMAVIVRDGIIRELNDLEANHPFYRQNNEHPQSSNSSGSPV